jgi:hypothetical protein
MDAKTRSAVRQRAGQKCEYCHLPEHADPYVVFHLEHITAKQHGGSDDLSNLAWACSRCNHRKGTNLVSRDPDNGDIVELYHPRLQTWSEHFSISRGRIVGTSPFGRATAILLDMNDIRRIRLRSELVQQGQFPLI